MSASSASLAPSPAAERVTSDAAFEEALALRYEVFCDEQRVPRELENDPEDAFALHVVVRDSSGRVCATGRLLRMNADGSLSSPEPGGRDEGVGTVGDTARIGRMAVRGDVRRSGLGRTVLEALERYAARFGLKTAVLHAQVQAEAFYAASGYVRQGEVFDEAGIPHVEMRKSLSLEV